MTTEYQCTKCNAINSAPEKREDGVDYVCHKCGGQLKPAPQGKGEVSAAVGMMGGAALGAAIGGPSGAIIGGIAGFVFGKTSKGLG